MAHRVFVLNGPGLDVHPHGRTTLAEIERDCVALARELDFDLFFGWSNQESQLLHWVHEAIDDAEAVVINPAGLSFRSVPLLEALEMLHQPVVEVHLTNIFRREPLDHRSITSHAACGLIAGLGASGYELAMRALADELAGT